MTADEVKAALAKAARRYWPNVKKASGLPFPDYWRGAAEWLCFHARHVGDGLMERFIATVVREAVDAEDLGLKPRGWAIPEKIREIWRRVESAGAAPAGLTDSSKTTTCGDGGRDRAVISGDAPGAVQGRLL